MLVFILASAISYGLAISGMFTEIATPSPVILWSMVGWFFMKQVL